MNGKEAQKKILFTAIGGSDPIRNCRDGAMLHICREYKPDDVYMYLSKEMYERHERDNRYLYCLEQLGKKIHHNFKAHIIQKPELIDVQVFDYFLEEFRSILNQIKKENADSQILLNVSSGTPAMKSALQILSAVSEIPIISIQVTTPAKSINPPEEDENDYETYWELNEDNEDHYENRCVESGGRNFLDVVKKETIAKQVRSCNYVVAIELAQSLTHPFNEEIMMLLKAAKARLELDYNNVIKELKGTDIKLFPVTEESKRKIFEYVLSLEIKIRKGEYADFVRAISPAVVEMFKLALLLYAKIDYKEYIKIYRDGEKWDLIKLEKNKAILDCLNEEFRNDFMGGYVYASNLLPLIKKFANNNKIVETAIKLRKVEEEVRNIAAHNICSVTGQWLKSRTGYTPEEIYKLFQDFINLLNFKIDKKDWDSYDQMNELITKKIREQ